MACTQRFQRGSISLAPCRYCAVEAEVLLHERRARGRARPRRTTCHRRYVFQSAIGVASTTALPSAKYFRLVTLSRAKRGAPVAGEVGVPVEGGSQLLELVQRSSGCRGSSGRAWPCGPGARSPARSRCAARPARRRGPVAALSRQASSQHAGHVLEVRLALLLRLGVVLQVVVAVGQAQAALAQAGDGLLWSRACRGRSRSGRARAARRASCSPSSRNRSCFDEIASTRARIGIERLRALCLDAGLVHAGRVVVADLGLDGRAARPWRPSPLRGCREGLRGCARPAR